MKTLRVRLGLRRRSLGFFGGLLVCGTLGSDTESMGNFRPIRFVNEVKVPSVFLAHLGFDKVSVGGKVGEKRLG